MGIEKVSRTDKRKLNQFRSLLYNCLEEKYLSNDLQKALRKKPEDLLVDVKQLDSVLYSNIPILKLLNAKQTQVLSIMSDYLTETPDSLLQTLLGKIWNNSTQDVLFKKPVASDVRSFLRQDSNQLTAIKNEVHRLLIKENDRTEDDHIALAAASLLGFYDPLFYMCCICPESTVPKVCQPEETRKEDSKIELPAELLEMLKGVGINTDQMDRVSAAMEEFKNEIAKDPEGLTESVNKLILSMRTNTNFVKIFDLTEVFELYDEMERKQTEIPGYETDTSLFVSQCMEKIQLTFKKFTKMSQEQLERQGMLKSAREFTKMIVKEEKIRKLLRLVAEMSGDKDIDKHIESIIGVNKKL